MKNQRVRLQLSLLMVIFLLSPGFLIGRHTTILIETEAFDDIGGWVVDQQFMDVMGSPFLMAHGLGRPVKDAQTRVEVPEDGILARKIMQNLRT